MRSSPEEPEADRLNVGRVLEQFAQLDPKSESFRYAVDRKGNTTLADVDRISIERMHSALTAAATWLDALDDKISEEAEVKEDYEREMRSWEDESLP